jgi:hypothetical protein
MNRPKSSGNPWCGLSWKVVKGMSIVDFFQLVPTRAKCILGRNGSCTAA